MLAVTNKNSIQPKLTIGQPNDRYEQEADHVADEVMKMPKSQIPGIQRKCAKCEEEELQMKPLTDSIIPIIQKQEEEEEEMLQMKRYDNENNSISGLESSLQQSKGNGQNLDDATQSFMSRGIGADFSNVKIHTDANAIQMNQQLNAKAFANGSDIYFNQGQYRPQSSEGKHLLAHELTHVVQQGGINRRVQRKLTKEEKSEDLQSDFLKHDERLQQAYDNDKVMKRFETSEGVKTLQRALVKAGYELPISYKKTGDADGIFGKETYDVVKQFQVDQKLEKKDHKAGRETLGRLDEIFLNIQFPCHIEYLGGKFGVKERSAFITNNFIVSEQPMANKILDDLCDTKQDSLSFSSEQELKDDILKRLKLSEYVQDSQTRGAFGYPESATNCSGKIGHALKDAQVNKAAKKYWIGPIIETRAAIKDSHYFFELSAEGKKNAYQALKLLFIPQSDICDKTLIHCDTLITLAQSRAYADSIGETVFNQKIQAGTLKMFLTYDGMTIVDGDTSQTPVSTGFVYVVPDSEKDLIIGDHVIFWNHLGYDAISVDSPGPWRLENAILVDKNAAGDDLYEGHGAPSINGSVQPGKRDLILDDLRKVYNIYAKRALAITKKVDKGETGAAKELEKKFPHVEKKSDNRWYVNELDRNKKWRPKDTYLLKEITSVTDPELIGLKNPYKTNGEMNRVKRPKESK